MGKFGGVVQGVVQSAVPAVSSVNASSPARAASFSSDVLVPAAQSAITGVLLSAVCTLLAAELTGLEFGTLKVFGLMALVFSSVTWLVLLRQHRALLWAVESVTGLDLDRDGSKGDPEKRRIDVRVSEGGHSRIVGADWLGLDDQNLIAFAAGLVGGRGLAEGDWAKDRAAFPRGINQFRAVRGKLVQSGLIRRVNPDADNSTFEVSPAGRAVFGKLAALTHAHTRTGVEK